MGEQVHEDISLCKHKCNYKVSCGHKCCKKTIMYGAISMSSTILTAATRVLGTPELLEQVLSFLPATDMLLATRICKGFKAPMGSSLILKKKLFMAHDSPLEQTVWVLHKGTLQHSYALTRRVLFNNLENDGTTLTLTTPDYYVPMVPNSRLFREHFHRNTLAFKILPHETLANTSCGEMYLTMPPAQKVAVQVWQRSKLMIRSRLVRVNVEAGIKFKDLIEKWHEALELSDQDMINEARLVFPRAFLVESLANVTEPKCFNEQYRHTMRQFYQIVG